MAGINYRKLTNYLSEHPRGRYILKLFIDNPDEWIDSSIISELTNMNIEVKKRIIYMLNEHSGCGAIERKSEKHRVSLLRCKDRELLIKIYEKSL